MIFKIPNHSAAYLTYGCLFSTTIRNHSPDVYLLPPMSNVGAATHLEPQPRAVSGPAPANHPLPCNPQCGMSALDFVLSGDRSGTESPDASCPPSDAGEVDDLLVRSPHSSNSNPFLPPPPQKRSLSSPGQQTLCSRPQRHSPPLISPTCCQFNPRTQPTSDDDEGDDSESGSLGESSDAVDGCFEAEAGPPLCMV